MGYLIRLLLSSGPTSGWQSEMRHTVDNREYMPSFSLLRAYSCWLLAEWNETHRWQHLLFSSVLFHGWQSELTNEAHWRQQGLYTISFSPPCPLMAGRVNIYLGLRVKCRRIVNSLTGSSLPLIDRERTDARHFPRRSKQWEGVSKAAYDPEKLLPPAMNAFWKKSTNESKRKQEQNLMRFLEQILELVMVLKKHAETLCLFSILTRQARQLKTFLACRKHCFNFIGLQ